MFTLINPSVHRFGSRLEFLYLCLTKVNRSKVKLLEDVLSKTAGMAHMDYLLWIEQHALVVNPAYVIPYKRYRKSGKDVVMYGNRAKIQSGDMGCAFPPSFHSFIVQQ